MASGRRRQTPEPGAGRIDQHEVHLAGELAQRAPVARRQHLRVPHPGPLQPLEDRAKPHAVAVIGVELPGILHERGERQGLAAGPGAKIDDLRLGLGAGEQRRELRALVLHLEPAFAVAGLGLDMGAPAGARGLHDAHPRRRMGCRRRIEALQRLQHLLARRFQRVHPEIDRRPPGKRGALLAGPRAERPLELRLKPLRIIAADGRRSIVRHIAREPRALGFAQRLGRVVSAIGKRRDLIWGLAPAADEGPEHQRARTCVAHGIGARSALAQSIEYEIADRGAVAGAGEAVRQTPILQRLGGRALARLDIGEDLDGRACPRRWCHYSEANSVMRAMTITHMRKSAMAPITNTAVRRSSRFEVTWI